MTGADRVRVLVVAGDAGTRAALREHLEADGMVARAEAGDQAAAIAAISRERPDLCLLVDGPPLDAMAATAALRDRAPDVPVVLLGGEPTDETLLAAVTAGAAGYLDVDAAGQRLTAALSDVLAGCPAFPRRLATLLLEDLRDPHRSR